MAAKPDSGVWRVHAGVAFSWLTAAFLICFGIMVALLAIDQQRVIDSNRRLQEKTLPEIIRFQRLARNLEQLRQEGERVFAAATPQGRQQAMFVVTLLASHPSVLADPEAADVARKTERFLGELVREAGMLSAGVAEGYGEWQRMAAQLGLLVDDVSTQAINLAHQDLDAATNNLQQARQKLLAVSAVVGLFMVIFLALLRRNLILPLQHIRRELSGLSVDRPAPDFKSTSMVEIEAVELAIGQLHASMVKNEETRQVLENLANKDGLTGLTNRRHFMLAADAELQRAQRYKRQVTIGMADLDFFKKLNDTYGHAAGDAVLRAFAKLTLEALRQSDLVCRYGGEEFAFLLPESSLLEAGLLAERYRGLCENHEISLPDGRLVRVTMSMGLADASDCSLDEALKRADDALYDAKRQGRNRVVVAGMDVKASG